METLLAQTWTVLLVAEEGPRAGPGPASWGGPATALAMVPHMAQAVGRILKGAAKISSLRLTSMIIYFDKS